MSVGYNCSFPGTQETNRDKGLLVSGLAIYHVFYHKVKFSNFILTEEDVEELVWQGFLIRML